MHSGGRNYKEKHSLLKTASFFLVSPDGILHIQEDCIDIAALSAVERPHLSSEPCSSIISYAVSKLQSPYAKDYNIVF